MKKAILQILVTLAVLIPVGSMACDDEVASQSREALTAYVESIYGKMDREAFGKVIAETLLSAATCDAVPLPVTIQERRGYYQGIFVIMQYAGVRSAADRPGLKALDENYRRLTIKTQEKAIEAVKK